MPAKGFAVLVALVLVSSVWAQDSSELKPPNELSFTAGRTFVSTQTIQNAPPGDRNPHIHFGNEESVAFNYGRLLKIHKTLGLYAEVPVAICPRMDLNTYVNSIPKYIRSLFMTPSLRLNLFPGDSVTPWVSAGGGYGRFWEAPTLNFYGTNPGPTGTNTGVAQFGAGVDVWFLHRWGARFEARDFYSGVPNLDVDTGRARQHNYYVGAGIAHRF